MNITFGCENGIIVIRYTVSFSMLVQSGFRETCKKQTACGWMPSIRNTHEKTFTNIGQKEAHVGNL